MFYYIGFRIYVPVVNNDDDNNNNNNNLISLL